MIVAPEPEAAEFVRVCDAYGAGYFYIPGTETCLRVHGYVRYDLKGGDDVYARTRYKDRTCFSAKDRDTYSQVARFTLKLSTASETELGTLRTYAETRYDWVNGKEGVSGSLRYGYIQLGGLRLGLDESAFVTFPGYLGNVIKDDVILAGGYRTNAISYTFTGGNGFSAIIALEQGGNSDVDVGIYRNFSGRQRTVDGRIDDYAPHVVAGLRFADAWGAITGVAAYDSKNEEWAGKVRLDVNVTEKFSVWAMGAYKSNDDRYLVTEVGSDGSWRGIRIRDSFYGTWGGDWSVWGGAKFKASDKATLNLQLAYEQAKTFAATANVAYELVPGLTVTPEISYTKWNDKYSDLKGRDAWQGMVRFQRSF